MYSLWPVNGERQGRRLRRSAGPCAGQKFQANGNARRHLVGAAGSQRDADPEFLSIGSEGIDDGGTGDHGVTFADGVGSAVRHGVPFELDPAVLAGIDAVFADDHAEDRPGFVTVCGGFRLIGADQFEVVVGGECRAEGVLFGEIDARRGVLVDDRRFAFRGDAGALGAVQDEADHAVVAAGGQARRNGMRRAAGGDVRYRGGDDVGAVGDNGLQAAESQRGRGMHVLTVPDESVAEGVTHPADGPRLHLWNGIVPAEVVRPHAGQIPDTEEKIGRARHSWSLSGCQDHWKQPLR